MKKLIFVIGLFISSCSYAQDNKYFVIELPDNAFDVILSYCVEQSADKCRTSNDGKKRIVKLPVGAEIPNILRHYQIYTHEEIIQELKKQEWKFLIETD